MDKWTRFLRAALGYTMTVTDFNLSTGYPDTSPDVWESRYLKRLAEFLM